MNSNNKCEGKRGERKKKQQQQEENEANREECNNKKLKVLHNGRCYKSSENTQRGKDREKEGERKIQLGRSCVLIYVTDEQQSALREKKIGLRNN